MTDKAVRAEYLEIRGLEFTRGDRTLFKDLDYGLAAGELLLVEGPNGSGKTTLLRTICGLLMPGAGEILWNGENIRSLREEYARDVLYMGHLNGIKNDLNAIENLHISATLDGDTVTESQVFDALVRMGLAGLEDLPTKVLSQGQKRRVALARLLLSSASLWVLDEPFVALDVKAVDQLLGIIAAHVAGGGMAVLTTHQEVALPAGQVRRLRLGAGADV